MVKAINAILIESSNLSRSVEFYNGLGINLTIHDHGGGQHAEADIDDCHFAIFPGGKEFSQKPNVRFSFHVPDLEECYKQLCEKGYKFESKPISQPFGGITANLTDPDGNRVTLMKWESDGK